jgi:hypothetical protein
MKEKRLNSEMNVKVKKLLNIYKNENAGQEPASVMV